ncbi:MAG TPA: MotA/TolQ/ExbB proton channel family protein [Gammaproteobacteria bacterium]|jgi:biopolymer transport protein ExbB|nr:MotA/TolQ/ExbB proton channel family protein [Gammaproteobacteria bacterium]
MARSTYARAMVVAFAVSSLLIGFAARAQDVKLTDLRQMVQKLRDDERRQSQERLNRFRAEQQRAERRTQDALARRNAAEARSNSLDKQWNDNEKRIAEIQTLLKQREGNLGELFGVTRQVAGDAANVLQQSVLSTQYGVPAQGEERAEFLRRLAGAKALPSITELERLWYELVREMTDAGKVVKYHAQVLQQDNTKVDKEVVRVGPFTVSSNGDYLGYLPSTKTLAELKGQLQGDFPAIGRALQAAAPGSGYQRAVVDPSRGALLGLYVERPTVIQRINQGEAVGWVIVAVGVIGLLVALYQAVYLLIARRAVAVQLKNLDSPTKNNALGRVLLSFRGDGKRMENTELAELRISEAVLREVPKLERFQSFLRLAVAAGPLLGLIGTVIGMIITFRAIVASGSSDPKLMATGIGQAMINTVLGLSIAIPLLFINAGLVALSRSVTQTLDEQSQSLLAEQVKQKHA